MVEVIRTVATSFKRSHDALLHSGPSKCSLKQLALKRATDDPLLCRRLLDTHGHVWVSFLWGHCSFLLGPGAHKVLFVPSKSLFPRYYGNSVIKFHWPPMSNSLGDPQVEKSVVGPRTLCASEPRRKEQ